MSTSFATAGPSRLPPRANQIDLTLDDYSPDDYTLIKGEDDAFEDSFLIARGAGVSEDAIEDEDGDEEDDDDPEVDLSAVTIRMLLDSTAHGSRQRPAPKTQNAGASIFAASDPCTSQEFYRHGYETASTAGDIQTVLWTFAKKSIISATQRSQTKVSIL
jgi:hypothetical protein